MVVDECYCTLSQTIRAPECLDLSADVCASYNSALNCVVKNISNWNTQLAPPLRVGTSNLVQDATICVAQSVRRPLCQLYTSPQECSRQTGHCSWSSSLRYPPNYRPYLDFAYEPDGACLHGSSRPNGTCIPFHPFAAHLPHTASSLRPKISFLPFWRLNM